MSAVSNAVDAMRSAAHYLEMEGYPVAARRLGDAIAALEREDWQPIETAPHQDAEERGVPILAWDGEAICLVVWRPHRQCWADYPDLTLWPDFEPTHWRPLPDPPQ